MIRTLLRRIPMVGQVGRWARRRVQHWRFRGSADFWESRYQTGGNSGAGSYGRFAEFKAEVLNAFVAERGVQSVIEFGCGDGNQLRLARYPHYSGYDISERAVASCIEAFEGDRTKRFRPMRAYDGEQAELALSLDVVYHLVEDGVFAEYMRTLFGAATRFVIVYSSNATSIPNSAPHVRHRVFTEWVEANAPEWRLAKRVPNRYPFRGDHTTGSFADFYIFERA